MSKRRVVVTGLGAVTPVGLSVAESWENILAGKSGVAPITSFDVTDFPVRFGASVKNFDVETVISRKDAKKMDTFIHYGIAAAAEAIKDAGLEVTDANATRIGCAVGSGIGGLTLIENTHNILQKSGPRRISPFFVPGSIINMISGNLAIKYGLKGPNIAITTACTTGTHNIGSAMRMIQYGDADVMLAGGAEMATTELGLGGFAAARALSTRNDDPQRASRPWDRDRYGFVLGDGAGVLVVEEYEHAKARGAHIYCELAGLGMSDDAHHMTAPPATGEGAANSMANAIRDAGLNADQVHYINAHGTSTPAGDLAETNAAKRVFGNAIDALRMSSTKSMTGHLLGAAGAVEAIFSILAIRDQVAPPTINLDNPSDECDLNYVAHQPQPCVIDVAVSNSFGFGGTNGTLVFRKI
jgi:3-oxoacyl-[acyl-carrier-protein] synthase II